jgi:hypothetical protein
MGRGREEALPVSRVPRAALRIAVCGLAAYGLAWGLLADDIVEASCRSKMWIVERNAMAAQNEGEWLLAAHGYAHLALYGDDSVESCRSEEIVSGSWKLPIVVPLAHVRWGSPGSDPDYYIQAYQESLSKAGVSALSAELGTAPADISVARRDKRIGDATASER